MRLATATKVRAAGVLYRAVRVSRRLLGRSSDDVVCKRGNLVWALNLSDGIQLSIYLFGAFERTTARALARLLPEGGVAIDVGANVGSQTLPMARRVGPRGKVIALEPTAWAVERLRRNLSLNSALAKNVSVYAAAAVARGEALSSEYYSSWPVSGAQDRHAVHAGVTHSAAGSVAMTLDELVEREGLSRLDVIKIDVDGGEVRVLRGARQVLSSLRPSLVLEIAPYALRERGDSVEELIALLIEARYRLLDERSFAPLATDAATLAETIPAGGSINVIAIPVERQAA